MAAKFDQEAAGQFLLKKSVLERAYTLFPGLTRVRAVAMMQQVITLAADSVSKGEAYANGVPKLPDSNQLRDSMQQLSNAVRLGHYDEAAVLLDLIFLSCRDLRGKPNLADLVTSTSAQAVPPSSFKYNTQHLLLVLQFFTAHTQRR
jgi:hypothetical protein